MENQTEQSGERSQEPISAPANGQPDVSISQEKLHQYIERLRLEQNLPLGLIVGLVASVGGAILWAAVTVSTGYQIGYMAVAVGLMVGYSIRFTGKGIDKIFGIVGAILAIFGLLAGKLPQHRRIFANDQGLGYLETLSLVDFSLIPQVMMETFSPIDLLFYGIAVYEGYKFSFREITEEDVVANAAA
ncbi:MAG: hypothetical protein HC880_07570 [Bacteroidia bacterium]|nr:hypothetical protein [Bacteroidia bacterium]